jgi:nitrogen fixation-related uncharacterized protein
LRNDPPPGRNLIGIGWVFVLQDDGRFQATAVAEGFSQIPGKDFHDSHAPVILFCVGILNKLCQIEAGQFDDEIVFLYGDLDDEEILMEMPEGYEAYYKKIHGTEVSAKSSCVKQLQALYGII